MLSVTERDEDLKLTQGLLVCVEIKGVGLLGTSQTAVPVVFLFESRGSHLGISVVVTLEMLLAVSGWGPGMLFQTP